MFTLEGSRPNPLSSDKLSSFSQKYNFIITLSKKRQLIVLAQVFFHYNKLEIAHHVIAFQAFIPAGNIHFFVVHQIFYYFPEHKIDLGLHTETQFNFHPDNIIGYNVFYIVFAGVWVVYRIHMHKPINIGALWFFVENGINDLVLNFLGVIGTGHIYQVRRKFGNCFIIAQFLYLRQVMFQPYKFNIPVFNLPAAVPDIHNGEQATGHQQCYIAAVFKFIKIGKQETEFYG